MPMSTAYGWDARAGRAGLAGIGSSALTAAGSRSASAASAPPRERDNNAWVMKMGPFERVRRRGRPGPGLAPACGAIMATSAVGPRRAAEGGLLRQGRTLTLQAAGLSRPL